MLTSFLFGYMVYQMYNAELTSYLTRQETEPNQTNLTKPNQNKPNQIEPNQTNKQKQTKQKLINKYIKETEITTSLFM
jgi:hypothetical protein